MVPRIWVFLGSGYQDFQSGYYPDISEDPILTQKPRLNQVYSSLNSLEDVGTFSAFIQLSLARHQQPFRPPLILYSGT